ncbi:uncharacterized protein METZ01_LOCUS267885 [marine metagenome]|uniref:site-specific DNA-methyltransferase (cytosine-N(4)-specific) n=1 Tax=marine metagenome TaxID=408172 RepID=A0A382JWU9_9ZZZZ
MKEFPYYPTDYTWRRKEFNQFLQYQDNLWENKDIKQTMHGLALCWSYMWHSWSVRCNDMNSPFETFYHDREKVLKKMDQMGHGHTPSGMRKTLRIMTGSQGVSNFRPTAAHAIYNRFLPDGGTTWDMSGGYGGRLLGAIKSQINYIATEPATETVKGLKEIIVDWSHISNIFRKVPHFEIVQKGSEDFLPDKESLDLCFTSPPYFNTEKYSDEETQSYIKFPTQDEWTDGFLRKTIQNCHYGLKQNRYMLINIANVKSFKHLEDTTVWIAEQEGFVLEEAYRLALSKISGNGFKYEPIFVFRKR